MNVNPNTTVFPFNASSDEKFMKANGNRPAKNFYEKCVPVFYYQPQPDDCEWVVQALLLTEKSN